jgi:hypothetical protein
MVGRKKGMGKAEDKLEIMDLIGRYSHAWDNGDLTMFAEILTSDGVLIEREGKNDRVRGNGLDDLIAFFKEQVRERGPNQPRHHVRNTIFMEYADSKSLTRSYFLMTNVEGPGKPAVLQASGVYEDLFIKTDKGWRIKQRIVIQDR